MDLQHDAHVSTFRGAIWPYVATSVSPKLSGKARKYSSNYGQFRVYETTDGARPAAINAKTVKTVCYDSGPVSCGSTERSEGVQCKRYATAYAAHLNRLHQHKIKWCKIKAADIAAETNEEFRAELIKAIGATARYARRAKKMLENA